MTSPYREADSENTVTTRFFFSFEVKLCLNMVGNAILDCEGHGAISTIKLKVSLRKNFILCEINDPTFLDGTLEVNCLDVSKAVEDAAIFMTFMRTLI